MDTYQTATAADRRTCGCAGAHSYTVPTARGGFVRVCRWGSAAAPSDLRAHGPRGADLDGVREVEALLGA